MGKMKIFYVGVFLGVLGNFEKSSLPDCVYLKQSLAAKDAKLVSLEKANFELKAKSDRLENQFLLVTQQNLNDFRSTLERLDAKYSAELSDLKSAIKLQSIEMNTLKLSESDLKIQL